MSTIPVAEAEPQPLGYGEMTQSWLRVGETGFDEELEGAVHDKVPLSVLIAVAATALLVVEVLAVVALTW